MSKDIVSQNQQNIDSNEFLSLQLLSQKQVEAEVRAAVELSMSSTTSGIISFITYLRIITQANYFISALNTNLVVAVYFETAAIKIRWMQFDNNISTIVKNKCSNENPIRPSGFYLPENGNNGAIFHDSIIEKSA